MPNYRGKLLTGDQVRVDGVDVCLEQAPGPSSGDLVQVTVPLACLVALVRVDRLAIDDGRSWNIKVGRITSDTDRSTATGYFETE